MQFISSQSTITLFLVNKTLKWKETFFLFHKNRLIAAVFECFYVKPGFFFFKAYLHENVNETSVNSGWEEWEEGRKNKVAEQTG